MPSSFLVKSFCTNPRKALKIFAAIGAMTFYPCAAQAKADDEQTQIILLNDSAAALEDSNPWLSKRLTKLADEKEKEWEYENANKNPLPTPVTDKDIPRLQDEIKILQSAAIIIQPVYPLITEGLKKMANGINRTIENEK